MNVTIASLQDKRSFADVLVLPYWQEDKHPIAAFRDVQVQDDLIAALEKDFTAEEGEINDSYMLRAPEKRVLLVGLGEKKQYSRAVLRQVFASVVKCCRKKKLLTINLVVPEIVQREDLIAIVDACAMANYAFYEGKHTTAKPLMDSILQKVSLLGVCPQHQDAIDRHLVLIEAVKMTQNLVNRNADDVQAKHLVACAEQMASSYTNLTCKVLGDEELKKEKAGLILAVNRGAVQDPALIILSYQGNPDSADVTAIVGKGVTYDTGGLNIKPTGSMETMRVDMAGAAAVLGIMQAIAALGMKKNVVGIIPAVENAVGPASYKPGDVYVSLSGKSVEIGNTDAEGRLILADAISYVQKYFSSSRIIDLATLTGGIVVAIGEEATGLFCNDEKLTKGLQAAGDDTGERVWLMPLYPEYRKALKSSIADLSNSAKSRKASPCMGAIFLEHFVDKGMPWAHLDIAGTAYLSETSAYYPSLATGVGVKLIVSFLDALSPTPKSQVP